MIKTNKNRKNFIKYQYHEKNVTKSVKTDQKNEKNAFKIIENLLKNWLKLGKKL